MRNNKILFRKAEGQLTVFMALVFFLVVSLLLAQYRSAVFYARRANAERAARLSAESFLAGYNRPLRDYYQILAVDGGFGQDIFQEERLEAQLLHVFEKNVEVGFGAGKGVDAGMEEPVFTLLIDGDWDFFLREICLNRMDVTVADGIGYIMEQWKSKNDWAAGDLSRKRQEAATRAETENVTDSGAGEVGQPGDTGQPEENEPLEVPESNPEPVTDPRDFVAEIWNQGILAAACPENFSLSEKQCPMTDVSFPEAGQKIQRYIDFKDDASIQDLFEGWDGILEPELGLGAVVSDGAVQLYIMEVFNHAATAESRVVHERVLNYEVEYILAGNESDSENLKTVLWKLLAFRCVMNLSHILMSGEKGVQAGQTAALLSTALLIPQFTEVVAFLLKCAWAFAESLSDCRTLLKGGKVPLMKDDTTWYLTWEQMLRLDGHMLDGNSGTEGIDYQGYLQMFLLLMKRDTKYRRMTHLMEKNIRLLPDYSEFQMANCIYGVQAAFDWDFGQGGRQRVQTALSY